MPDPGIVGVGHGNIGERLKSEFEDERVRPFLKYRLYVGWAPAAMNARLGIVIYLMDKLSLKVEAKAIPVNLPWRLKEN